MSEPPDLRDLAGDDEPDALDQMRLGDELLRTVPPPPPELPASLTQRVLAIAATRPPRSRRRVVATIALAAALAVLGAALFFGLGYWAGGDEFTTVRTVALRATESAPGASGEVRLGPLDEASGNWEMVVEVEGLPSLPADEYYVLWLARDGEYAATCGTFNVGPGLTTVRMNASYRLADYDEWVISARTAGREEEPEWLLHART
jgi:hypothetical protein